MVFLQTRLKRGKHLEDWAINRIFAPETGGARYHDVPSEQTNAILLKNKS